MNSKKKYNVGDVIGNYGNKLLEITKVTSYGHRYGLFLCGRCGKNTFEAKIYHVSSDKILYCRECRKETRSGKNAYKFIDLTNQRFGKLIAIEYYGSKIVGYTAKGEKLTRSLWKCVCECGRYKIVDSSSLRRGLVSSCGYCSFHSNGEYKISTILEEQQYKYYTQYSFSDCYNPKTNMRLRFDFYLPDYNCCIEYDGTSHYKPNIYGSWNTEDSVKETRYRDVVKDNYCKQHSIGLIRIPYWEFDKIDSLYIQRLLFSHRGGEVDELQCFSEPNQ